MKRKPKPKRCKVCGGETPYSDRLCSACQVAAGFRAIAVLLERKN